ncbi:MAG: hypothetical protein JWO35_248 [Candidatus Saccharibacteria bacterium]|nr:hypothetical protein [Candidatus Saccharibacteria bacterium]
MSKTKRNDKGQFAKRSAKFTVFSWFASFASLGLLYAAGAAVYSTFGSFRSCGANSSGLAITSCGKQSINIGDLIILGLFVASALLAVSLFTAAWRMTLKRGTV